jgi:uncharacterized protein (TIGR02145 family)
MFYKFNYLFFLSFKIFIHEKICLSVCLSVCLSFSLNGQSTNSQDVEKSESIQRNATYNLEEIKVRWKKAALENCPGVPCVTAPSFTCGTSTMTDKDNNTYSTVSIGAQCWTTTNLKVTKYSDGVTPIPDLTSSTSNPWATSGARTDYTGATGISGAVPSGQDYVSTYGYLYNWFAVNDAKGLCPSGWHVPTDAEWTTLETYLNTVAPTGSVGGKMKKNDALWSTNTGTNTSGFSALPGGYRRFSGSFTGIRTSAFFWSASEFDASLGLAWYRFLSNADSDVKRISAGAKSVGASVRCLRD